MLEHIYIICIQTNQNAIFYNIADKHALTTLLCKLQKDVENSELDKNRLSEPERDF